MIVAYSPMYPKLLHRFISTLGPVGLKNFSEDSNISIDILKEFSKTKNIEPLAENIPNLWSLIFEKRTPIQALNFLEKLGM